jgi:transposase
MERELIVGLLGEGLSVEAIGRRVGKHRETVAYWMDKYGLAAPNSEKHAAKGGIERAELERFVDDGLSIAEIACRLERSKGTVRHWLTKYELHTHSTLQRRRAKAAREAGAANPELQCPHHGQIIYMLDGRGIYRCPKCRSDAVSRRRRLVKRVLVEEAGGCCALCGYDRSPAALEFHHVDPASKSFSVGLDGVTRSLERAREEVRKCILLCSNCHAEVEVGFSELPADTS